MSSADFTLCFCLEYLSYFVAWLKLEIICSCFWFVSLNINEVVCFNKRPIIAVFMCVGIIEMSLISVIFCEIIGIKLAKIKNSWEAIVVTAVQRTYNSLL